MANEHRIDYYCPRCRTRLFLGGYCPDCDYWFDTEAFRQ
jgi:hypothetical protein